ncbi:MAG: DNA mismatch repair endonuclease MutL, partial [Myxococcales bacterium]|nr:DNA mismatch repair endonuclease MutL [Myxococcales bacterium]
MTDRIEVLPEGLVNQIAAGEVVERPASVVKELIDNALDAQARHIIVDIADGGLGRIRVTDDGIGMSPTDATRALARHATSKIRNLEDLEHLHTLGFRGEALPSIASVSRFALTTRMPDSEEATSVAVDGDGTADASPAGAPPGTTVEVKDLFFNVPARRKFLKSQATEAAHISDVCLRAALTRPDVRFTSIRNGRGHADFVATESRAERCRQIFQKVTLQRIAGERDGISVEALLGAPEGARSGATALHLVVNDRPVRDRALARAVAFAYGSVLPPGKYPVGAVFVDLPPDQLDVNVHPQKTEVRFARSRLVYDAVTRILANHLGTVAWARPSYPGSHRPPFPAPSSPAPHPSATAASLRPDTDPWDLRAALRQDPADRTGEQWGESVRGGAPQSRAPQDGAVQDEVVPYGATPSPSTSAPPLDDRGFFGSLRFLAQVRRMLLVCEGPDGLYLIDQHAADERLRYNRLRRAYADRAIPKQRLLFPERIHLSHAETAWIGEHVDTLDAVGFDCAPVGDDEVALRAIPALLARTSPQRLLREALLELCGEGDRDFGARVD